MFIREARSFPRMHIVHTVYILTKAQYVNEVVVSLFCLFLTPADHENISHRIYAVTFS